MSTIFAALCLPALVFGADNGPPRPDTLDLRTPMALAANAIPPRLDSTRGYRPFFMIRGKEGVPHAAVHDVWDLGDMTGRYLESLIHARTMGITSPELSLAEERLGRYLLSIIGPDGRVHNPDTNAADHPFSQGSALFGLLAWFESTGDPTARHAIERMIHGLYEGAEKHGDYLTDPDAKLPESSGSHLAGYQIFPIIRFHELTGSPEALTLAEGLTRWVIDHDPTLGPDNSITQPLSWEGHIHSWFEALAGCLRTARVSPNLDRLRVRDRCRGVYDWVKRTNGTDFGWFATYPTGGSCETCAISSAIRLALELSQDGYPEYLNDVERFVRNQVLEAQFRDPGSLARPDVPVSPLLLGTFDSQSMPNSHLGTRGGEDVGTVEGCCLNGGTRAIYQAWQSIVACRDGDVFVNLAINRDSPWARVISYLPHEARVDVMPRYRARRLHIRLPDWADAKDVKVAVEGRAATGWTTANHYLTIASPAPGQTISVSYPLRRITQEVTAGGKQFRIAWRGDTAVKVYPPGERDRLYQRAEMDTDTIPLISTGSRIDPDLPDTWFVQDSAVAAAENILARLDPERAWQPFFRIYPFADPPYASHEKWDDGDMAGRYVEALIAARRMTGIPMDPRELGLRRYLASLFDRTDGLCYTQQADWTPRRACMFSQSCAMLGLIAWYDETKSPQAKALLDGQVDGLMRLAQKGDGYVFFPKYEYDGEKWLDEPVGKDAPAWFAGRIICPLVEYHKRFPRPEVKQFIEQFARYCIEMNPSIRPDGSVTAGEGWWAHLHGTQDMVAGIAEYARMAEKPEWIAWAQRVYEWIGRTNTARFGWSADCVGSHICESCTIAARFRLGLALYRAGAVDPFDQMDRFTRNQLMENQFDDLSFVKPLRPQTPRTSQRCYQDVDRMILGAFQCWGTANDLIGHTDIEGCGAGGGMQALYFAWLNAVEWKGGELWIQLLLNRGVGVNGNGPVGPANPPAAEISSFLPYEGKVSIEVHRPLNLRIRLPEQTDASAVSLIRRGTHAAGSQPGSETAKQQPVIQGRYVCAPDVAAGECITLTFPLPQTQTQEIAAGKTYQVSWKGNTVLKLDPPGEKIPLYSQRGRFRENRAPLCPPRYP